MLYPLASDCANHKLEYWRERLRKIVFHPKATIIKGANSTGKSCLVKSIFTCLGADPEVVANKWLNLEVKAILKFKIGEKQFGILQEGNSYLVLDKDQKILSVSRGNKVGLSEFFFNFCDFRMQLPDAQGALSPASPAHFFLPFYIDQDTGWSTPWSSFLKDEGISRSRTDCLEYHVGIRNNEYYEAKAKVRRLQQELKPVTDRIDILMGLSRDLDSNDKSVDFDLNVETYKKEIDRLIERCRKLAKKEEEYRQEVLDVHEHRISLEEQLSVAENALTEISKDYSFSLKHLKDGRVDCPLCGAEYNNSIIERFALARDEDRLQDIASKLSSQISEVNRKLEILASSLNQTIAESQDVADLLAAKQGELTLQELLRAEGRKQVRGVLQGEILELNKTASDKSADLKVAEEALAEGKDADRQKRILIQYQEHMRSFRSRLAAWDLSEATFNQLNPRINVVGSEKPRAILNYRWAILHLVREFSSATFCPIVIDSPYQQDQDNESRTRMMKLINDSLPKDSQIILSLVDDSDVTLKGTTIELKEERGLLRADEYEEVAKVFRPILAEKFKLEA